MRKIQFDIPIYDWDVTIVTIYNQEDEEPLRQELVAIDAEPNGAEEDLNNVRIGAMNGGDTWWDKGKRQALIIIFPWTDRIRFYNTLNHEKRHLVDRIMEHAHIENTEAAAYLDGYVSAHIFKHLKELIT